MWGGENVGACSCQVTILPPPGCIICAPSLAQVREANQMVEEMMLLANISVAEKIVAHFPSCSLLRRHPTPEPKRFDPVVKAAAAAGFEIDIQSSKVWTG